MENKYKGIDFSQKPDFMSMQQYGDPILKEQRMVGRNGTAPDNFSLVGDAMFGKQELPATLNSGSLPSINPQAVAMPSAGSVPPSIFSTPTPQEIAKTNLRASGNADTFGLPMGGAVTEGQIAPIPNGQTFTTPSGGQVTMPATMPSGRTAQEIHQAINPTLGGPATQQSSLEDLKKARAEQMQQSATDRVGVRALIGSLEKQGMTRDEIAKEIGYDSGMSASDAKRGLSRLQKKKAIQQSDTRTQKRTEEIQKRAEYNEDGTFANDDARFLDMDNTVAGTGDDPMGESFYDKMNDSDKREYKRLRDKVSEGRAKDRDFNRIDNVINGMQAKSTASRVKRETKEAKQAFDKKQEQAESLIQSREDRKRYQEESKQFDILRKDWETKFKEGASEDDIKTARDLMDAFEFSFNQEDVTDGNGLMTRDQFVADFASEEGRNPTEEEINALNGKAWQ